MLLRLKVLLLTLLPDENATSEWKGGGSWLRAEKPQFQSLIKGRDPEPDIPHRP